VTHYISNGHGDSEDNLRDPLIFFQKMLELGIWLEGPVFERA
jgi:hypothetical protein